MPEYKQTNNQIIRKDGKNCFVEVLNNYFRFNKVAFNFVEYDPNAQKGNKFKNQVMIFMDFDVFLRVSHDFLVSKRIPAQLAKSKADAEARSAKSGKTEYPIPFVLVRGGTSEERLKARGAERPDGKALAKLLKLSPGFKFPCMFRAEQGPGKSNETGLIVPQYDKPEQMVQIGLSTEAIKELFITVETHVKSYISASVAESYNSDKRENESRQTASNSNNSSENSSSKDTDTKKIDPHVVLNALVKKANAMPYDTRIKYLLSLGFDLNAPVNNKPTSVSTSPKATNSPERTQSVQEKPQNNDVFDENLFDDVKYDNYFDQLFN